MTKLQNLAEKVKKLIVENQFILYLFIFFVAFFTYLWIQASPTFLDPDSFYHLKMAKLIAQRGPILNFPWQQFTVLKDYYIDHHFLYHVSAIPFVKFLGDLAGFKFFTALLAALFIFLSFVFFKKAKIKYATIFSLVLLFSPAFMFRISLGKATAFSLIILFLGIYCLFQKKYWWLFALSFLYVWSYGGFLLLLVMALLYVLATALYETFISPEQFFKIRRYFVNFLRQLFSREKIKTVLAVLGGTLAGLIINPYFPKNLKFYWQQLVQIGLINYRGVVNVGGEWYPYKTNELFIDCSLAIIFALVSLILFVLLIKKQKPENIFFLLAAILFTVLTLKSKRYVEYFVPFWVYFSAFSFKALTADLDLAGFINKVKNESKLTKYLLIVILIYSTIMLPAIMIKDTYLTRQSFKGGISFTRFKGISQYLINNTQPGTIIMHTDWDNFPELFYNNDKDYYIVGLDPTFMYNYDAKKYILFADITMAKITQNLYKLIKDNFQADYFIVNSDRAQLTKNLQNDGNFTKVYSDNDGSVYKLK